MRRLVTLLAVLIGMGSLLSQPVWAAGPAFTSDISITVGGPSADGTGPDINFNDGGLNEADWEICIDQECPGTADVNESFHIANAETSTIPFIIENGAADHLLYLDAAERVGINTNVPIEELDIRSTLPGIRLDDISAGAGQADIQVNTNELEIEGNSGQDIVEIDTQAPANSFTIDDVGRVGFGTAVPTANLHINGGATQDVFNGIGPDPQLGPAMNFGYSGGSFGRGSGFFNVRPDALATGINPSLRFATNNIQRMVITNAGRVGIGTVGPSQLLDVNGNIRASGNFISGGTTLNVPDYVFEEDYALTPLPELEAYVQREKRLPDMPSAAEIKAEGVNLTEFQMQLLKKVEELTLYTLEQEQTMQEQQETIQQLSTRLAALEQAAE